MAIQLEMECMAVDLGCRQRDLYAFHLSKSWQPWPFNSTYLDIL